ncbi:MAG: lysophospholipid acyltransferase family protein [Candidatus Omnitrophota bacterium]
MGNIWEFIEFSLVRSLMLTINVFPIAVSTWIARRMGDVMFFLLPSRRKVALENLTIAFGDSKSNAQKINIARESFRHLATSFMEYFRLPKFVKKSEGYVHLIGTEHLDRAFERGKGAVLVMSHLGPWEYLVFLSYLKKYPTSVLSRPIKNPYFYRWIKSLRNLMDLSSLDKTDGVREILSQLKQNHLVAMVIDQWAGSDGIWTNFFNLPTSTTPLPARLARKTGCALIPAYCIRRASGQYEVHVEPEVVVEEDKDGDKEMWVKTTTERLNHILEQQISAFAGQWVWTHRRWKDRYNKQAKINLLRDT